MKKKSAWKITEGVRPSKFPIEWRRTHWKELASSCATGNRTLTPSPPHTLTHTQQSPPLPPPLLRARQQHTDRQQFHCGTHTHSHREREILLIPLRLRCSSRSSTSSSLAPATFWPRVTSPWTRDSASALYHLSPPAATWRCLSRSTAFDAV